MDEMGPGEKNMSRYSDEEYEDEFWDDPDEWDDREYDDLCDDGEEDRFVSVDRGRDRNSRRGRKSRRGSGIILRLMIVVFAAVFAVAAYQAVTLYLAYQTAIDEYDVLAGFIEAIPQEQEETVREDESSDGIWYPLLSIDYASLKEINGEFVGVIHIPVLDLTYPVAQTTDNEKYLTTTFEGTTNSSGCIFLDKYASSDFSDSNTFIFGHNMKNQTMFGSLKLFLQDEELCDQDPYVYIYQEDQVLVYRIFAYYTIPVDDDVYADFSGEDGYDAYVRDALAHSNYALDEDVIDWTKRPNLLTLSTCYSTGHTHNFVVQSVLVGIAEQ